MQEPSGWWFSHGQVRMLRQAEPPCGSTITRLGGAYSAEFRHECTIPNLRSYKYRLVAGAHSSSNACALAAQFLRPR